MSSGQVRVALLAGLVFGLGAGASAQEAAPSGTALPVPPVEGGGSLVRIVRLSDVRGSARLDRNTGMGYEAAFANIPIVAGAKLRTYQGVAEVEFEDNSTLRLTPDTEVRFAQLSRMPTGGTVTTVEVLQGTAYVNLEKDKGNAFTLKSGTAQVVLTPGAHVRLDTRGTQARLAVFDGNATLALGATSNAVSKRQTVELDGGAGTVSAVQGGTAEEEFDAWDKQGQQYHKLKANALANSGGFGAYGANDLNYYGSFVDMPGCGSMWRPYFANAAWDPFAAGVWAWYPTAGYSWVSPYPWGWLPYHSGSWANCGAAGWGWRPGGSWVGLNNVATMRIAKRIPHPMPGPPVVGRRDGTLVPVNMKALAISHMSDGERFTFQQNSAGLGVPRSSFSNLHHASIGMERHGEMSHGVYANGLVAAPMPMHREGAEPTRSAAYASSLRGQTPGANGSATPTHAGWSGGNGGGTHGNWGGGGSGGGRGGWSGGGGAGGTHSGWTGGGASSAGGGGGHMGGGGGVSSGGAAPAGGGGGAAAGGGHH